MKLINRLKGYSDIFYLKQAKYINLYNMKEILSMFRQSPQNKTKDARFAIYYVLALCISEFYFGYQLVYLSAIDFNIIVEKFKIDFDASVAQGIFQGIMPIGGAIGALCSAFFVKIFSRRNLIFFFNVFCILLSILSIITNYQLFLVVRFFQGVLCGSFSAVIPMLIREVSPHEISSITGSFANLIIILGLFFLYTFGYVLKLISGDPTGGSTWQIVFLFPIITTIIQTLLLIYVYPFETPKYLAHNNKTSQLKQLMAVFYKTQHVQQMYTHFMKHHGPHTTPQQEEHRSSAIEEPSKDSKGSKCALIYGIFYAFLCPMSGINVIMSYGGQVVSKIAPQLRSIMPAILMLFYLFSSFISIIFIKKYGRKALTIAGTIGLLISLYVISYAYFITQTNISLSQFLIVLFLFVYLLIYGLTYAPVMWMWVSEALLPHTIGIAVMTNWSGASLVMISFPILLEHIPGHNPAYIFLFFAVYLTLSIPVTNKLMLETKDKFEHEIMEEYKKLDEDYFGTTEPPKNELEMKLVNK